MSASAQKLQVVQGLRFQVMVVLMQGKEPEYMRHIQVINRSEAVLGPSLDAFFLKLANTIVCA